MLAVQSVFMTGSLLHSAGIKAAVASNFHPTMTELAEEFKKQHGLDVVLIFGSSGKHYAQIVNGAPFDVFFSADSERPKLLEEQKLAQPNTRFTYAIGRLALWSQEKFPVDAKTGLPEFLSLGIIAIAEPKVAPYGLAAEETMNILGIWGVLNKGLVRGENINQVFDFVRSGAAQAGFVAWSQIIAYGKSVEQNYWLVPQEHHSPVMQQAIQIKPGDGAAKFLGFVRSSKGQSIIKKYGYEVP